MAPSLPQLGFWRFAAADPEHIAAITPEGESITAGALLNGSNQLVHALRALGLKNGDTIATLLENGTAMLEVYMAATQAGLYITPINTHSAAPEISYILGDCEAKAFFVSARYSDTSLRAVEQIGFPKERCYAAPSLGDDHIAGHIEGFASYEALKDRQPVTMPSDRSAGLVMNYTSGTTGNPKGVRRQLPPGEPEVIASSYASFLLMFGITPRENGVHLVVSPLYHTAVLNFCTNHLHLGHTVVLMDKWTPEGTLERIEKYQVTTSHMVPTHFSRLLALPQGEKNKHDLSSLRHVIHSAAPCPVPVKHRMLEWWGPVIYEYYSASEGGGTTATPQDWLKHPGTVGKPWPISQIRILDDSGNPVSVGTVGTVYIQMGQYKFEYHKDQKKTDSAWKEGFFTVGDAGYLDEEGFLYLCDRKADMIISGGVNIYPAEIESVLGTHPAVADVAVFGIPDEDWGEQVKAVIELRADMQAGPTLGEEIMDFCRQHLASYKTPKTVDFVPTLPRDPNGKLYKRKLRDPYWEGRDRKI